MKYSGVLPVGNETTPPGLSCNHSMNRIAVYLPKSGKFGDIIIPFFTKFRSKTDWLLYFFIRYDYYTKLPFVLSTDEVALSDL
jgi:hypothetical protein